LENKQRIYTGDLWIKSCNSACSSAVNSVLGLREHLGENIVTQSLWFVNSKWGGYLGEEAATPRRHSSDLTLEASLDGPSSIIEGFLGHFSVSI
jgi:hypothetical protein